MGAASTSTSYQRVCPPLFAITAVILSGIVSINFRISCGVIFAHSSKIAALMSSLPLGLGYLAAVLPFNNPQTFSSGFKSRELASQSMEGILY